MTTPHIAVIMACHNRSPVTERCLVSLFAQHGIDQRFRVSVSLVDDGSTDGTAQMVRRRFPAVDVLAADGGLFWAGGMRMAEQHALRSGWDFLFWLNDDVELEPDAVLRLLDVSESAGDGAIVVGATRWRNRGRWSYGGAVLKNPARPTSLRVVFPADGAGPAPIDAFEGNFVCVPRAVHERVGRIDGGFRHAYADIDYGLRARSLGVRLLMAPGSVGRCDGHPHFRPWHDTALDLPGRLRTITSRKGLPPRSHWRFVHRYGGKLAPVYFLASYLQAGKGALLAARLPPHAPPPA